METPKNKIQCNLIPRPKITFSREALEQLNLIAAHDFTLEGKNLRITISGKNCEGFTYSVGFTEKDEDDLLIETPQGLTVLLDPFTAFYLQEATIDYQQNFGGEGEEEEEGLVIINHRQGDHAGKFWRNNPEKMPPVRTPPPLLP